MDRDIRTACELVSSTVNICLHKGPLTVDVGVTLVVQRV